MNYKVIEDDYNNYSVVETSKDNEVLGVFKTRNEAKELMRFHNLGGGFDGWTPSFILRSVSIDLLKEDTV